MLSSEDDDHIKDKRGTLDHWGSPDRTMQPQPDSSHGTVFCLICVVISCLSDSQSAY